VNLTLTNRAYISPIKQFENEEIISTVHTTPGGKLMGFARLLNLNTPCSEECILKFGANCKLKKEGKGTLMMVAQIAEMENRDIMALSLNESCFCSII
jgi:hypothetical protein